MRTPWAQPWRLGAKIFKVPGEAKSGVSWAAIALTPRVIDEGRVETADPIKAAIDTYRAEAARRPGCKGVTLYRYATEQAYRAHRPESETMSWADHNALIREARRRFWLAAVPYKIKVIR